MSLGGWYHRSREEAFTRDARHSPAALFVRVWLIAGVGWAACLTLGSLILPRLGQPWPTESPVRYWVTGLAVFGPLIAAMRLVQVQRWRRRREARESPARST